MGEMTWVGADFLWMRGSRAHRGRQGWIGVPTLSCARGLFAPCASPSWPSRRAVVTFLPAKWLARGGDRLDVAQCSLFIGILECPRLGHDIRLVPSLPPPHETWSQRHSPCPNTETCVHPLVPGRAIHAPGWVSRTASAPSMTLLLWQVARQGHGRPPPAPKILGSSPSNC